MATSVALRGPCASSAWKGQCERALVETATHVWLKSKSTIGPELDLICCKAEWLRRWAKTRLSVRYGRRAAQRYYLVASDVSKAVRCYQSESSPECIMWGIKCYALRLYIENGCQTPDHQKRKSTRKRRHRAWNSGIHGSGSGPFLIFRYCSYLGRVPRRLVV